MVGILLASVLTLAHAATGGAQAARALIRNRCGICHRGPFLDFSHYPFYSDRFSTERELLTEGLRRARLTGDKRMPPVNYPALNADDLATLQAYLDSLE